MAERITIIDFVEKYVAKYSKNPFLYEKNMDTNEWEPTTYDIFSPFWTPRAMRPAAIRFA